MKAIKTVHGKLVFCVEDNVTDKVTVFFVQKGKDGAALRIVEISRTSYDKIAPTLGE